MSKISVRVFTKDTNERVLLEAIFSGEHDRGAISVGSVLTGSAVTSNAEYSLMTYPQRPVALVFNASAFDPLRIEEERAAVRRILSRVARSGWQDTWANPDVFAWVMADPRIKRCVEENRGIIGNLEGGVYLIRDWAREESIDRKTIARVHPEFRELAEFIEEHAPADRAMASAASAPELGAGP